MFELVQSAFEGRDGLPRSSELVGQFVDTFFGCIRSNSMVGEYNVANGVRARIWATGIDELTMVSMVFWTSSWATSQRAERCVARSFE